MTGKKLLIVASPTLDIIEAPWGNTTRPGGPGLYITLAARLLGYETYLAGPYGYSTLQTTYIESLLGGKRICCKTSRKGAVFHLQYNSKGERREEYLGEENTINPGTLEKLIETIKPDILILAPVYGELTYDTARLLYQLQGPCTGLDIQGFIRTRQGCPPLGIASVIHGSPLELEECPYKGSEWIRVETRGPEPFCTFTRWGERIRVEPTGGLLEDPTGAGDIFLFGVMHSLCTLRLELRESLIVSTKLVASVLSRFRVENIKESFSRASNPG